MYGYPDRDESVSAVCCIGIKVIWENKIGMREYMGQKENDKELEILELYLEELRVIPKIKPEEKEKLWESLKAREEKARTKLAESYLLTAVEIAAQYKNRGIGLADLIQEANMGLMAALSETEQQIDDEFIRKNINIALKRAVQEEIEAEEAAQYLTEQVNRLDEAAKELAERNGREASVEELAQYLHMTEEEVKEFMKISLDASSLL